MSQEADRKGKSQVDMDDTEVLSNSGNGHDDVEIDNKVDETANELMTDMKLEDEGDEDLRSFEPNIEWEYFIEVYPWDIEDVTENFSKLIRLAQFSRLVMKKKTVKEEPTDSDMKEEKEEKLKLSTRQRRGCLQLFMKDRFSAKLVMRNMTWKSMSGKQLHVEITRRDLETEETETASLDVNTYLLCKCRFREKAKGELKDRSAKVSDLNGRTSQGFMEVVLNRAYPVVGGQTQKASESDPYRKIQEFEGFDGSIDFDCLTRGSCRAFVLAHERVILNGNKLNFVANDKATMVVPPFTHDAGTKKQTTTAANKPVSAQATSSLFAPRGRGNSTGMARGAPGMFTPRMPGRGLLPLMRPMSAPLLRNPGAPVPMTGRQKMNEKLRRNNIGMNTAVGGPGGMGMGFSMPGGHMGRGQMDGSVGASFKHEIASLQNQLVESTKAIEAKIAMLQQGAYEPEMMGFESGPWSGDNFGGFRNFGPGEYAEDNMYGSQFSQNFASQPVPLMQSGARGGRGGMGGTQRAGFRGASRGGQNSSRGMGGMRGMTSSRGGANNRGRGSKSQPSSLFF